ncbi:MAG: hypothetical protein ACLFTJ_00280 [Halothece sp.]
MQLEQFNNNEGIELYIDMETGASFASQRGYARMAGVPESTLRGRLSTSQKITLQGDENLDMSEELTSPNCIVQTQFRDSLDYYHFIKPDQNYLPDDPEYALEQGAEADVYILPDGYQQQWYDFWG